ncbi:MAG: Arc family DNA-binding protein [Acidimicrobiia bacterium]|nr:Arc family DNA-binding protein [Acidimicrobiia bacterium]
MTMPMTPDEQHAFYADPANQTPKGSAVRRRAPLGDPVPVRFPADLLDKVRGAAAADDRSVSSWIRRAVENELERELA